MIFLHVGWEGAGLGKSEQGIQDPIKQGEVRDKQDMFKVLSFSNSFSNKIYHVYNLYVRLSCLFYIKVDNNAQVAKMCLVYLVV